MEKELLSVFQMVNLLWMEKLHPHLHQWVQ